MLRCLPCLGEMLVSTKLRDGCPPRDSCLTSSWLKAASGPKQYVLGYSTPGTVGHQLWSRILDMIGSL
jgi:hypothetical protein